MRTREFKGLIEEIYEANKAGVLLLGPPGIGKSVVVREAAIELAKKQEKEFVDYSEQEADRILADPHRYFVFVDFRLTEAEPSDLLGIPKEIGGAVMYVPLLWAKCLSQSAGILFLDELTNIQRLDVLSASYKLFLDREAGFTRFSSDVMVLSAGNRPEESAVANRLPAPLIDRVLVYDVDTPKITEWAEWMDTQFEKWDRRILGYLMHFKGDFLKLPDDPDTLTNFPTPRSFTEIATLGLHISPSYYKATAIASLGPEVGEKLVAFLKVNVPSAEELIASPQQFPSLGLDGKYLASVVVGNYLGETPDDKTRTVREAERAVPLLSLMSDTSREFVVLSIVASGKARIQVANAAIKKEKKLRECLKELTEFRNELEGIQ